MVINKAGNMSNANVNKIKIFSCVILIFFSTLLMAGCQEVNAESVIQNLKQENYKEAVNEYPDLSESEKNKTKESFIEQISNIEKKYINEEIGISTAKENFELLKSVEAVSDLAVEKESLCKKIAASRKNYDKAVAYEADENYLEASKCYSNVIPEDEKNYSKAQESIPRVEESLVSLELIKVQSASISVQSTEWKSLYPDMLIAIIKNDSQETIKDFDVSFLGYDPNGYPKKIKGQYSFGNAQYEHIGTGEDVNVLPGGTFGDNVGWELAEGHGIEIVKACVKSATFYNGETWTNPLYDSWLAKYKDKPSKAE